MKKILIVLFLLVSTITFSRTWGYAKEFRYDLEGNIQVVGTVGESKGSRPTNIAFSMLDNDYLTFNISGNYVMGSVFDVQIYVDERKVETLKMVAVNRLILQGVASRKLVNSFRNGNKAILAFSHSNGNSVIRVDLNRFNNSFRQIKYLKYYNSNKLDIL